MGTWMYQIDQSSWSPQRYRLEIWERERWAWPVGRKVGGADSNPEPGDTVIFFYAPSGGNEPGFYGWAVTLDWRDESGSQLHFRPVAPSDYLKMHPWWDKKAGDLADQVRGKVKQGTLWLVPHNLAIEIRRGVSAWLGPQSV